MQMLIQPQYEPMTVEDQVIQIYAAVKGYLMPVEVKEVPEFEEKLLAFMHANYPEVGQDIAATKVLSKENEAVLVKAIGEFTKEFGETHQLIKEEE